MKVTISDLEKKGACADGKAWFIDNFKNGVEESKLILTLTRVEKYDWARWYLCKVLTKEQSVKIAIYAAEQVIGIFEKKYPKDDRPRKAIEAAKKYLKNPCQYAAYVAANAANAAYVAANAANAAYAAYAADAAANAANAAYAADAADAAARAAAARAAEKELKNKILKYAIKIRGVK